MKPGTKSAIRRFSLAALAGVAVLTATAAQAVMPPYVYERQARESKIKAIAVLEHMTVEGENNYSLTRKLRFKLEKSLAAEPAGDVFFGTCHSVKPGGHPPPGGTIYYRPEAGKRYFVTIANDGGAITSLTLLTPVLEKALLYQPDKVQFSFGTARVKE
jgi:hypothetical protein